jgi:hypothetical protein
MRLLFLIMKIMVKIHQKDKSYLIINLISPLIDIEKIYHQYNLTKLKRVIQDGSYSVGTNFIFIQHQTNIICMREGRKKRHTLLKIKGYSNDKFYTLICIWKVEFKSTTIEKQEAFFSFFQTLEDSKISFLLWLFSLVKNLAVVSCNLHSSTYFIYQILLEL